MPRRFTDHQRTIARQILTLLRAHPLGLTKQDMCTRLGTAGECPGKSTVQRALVGLRDEWNAPVAFEGLRWKLLDPGFRLILEEPRPEDLVILGLMLPLARGVSHEAATLLENLLFQLEDRIDDVPRSTRRAVHAALKLTHHMEAGQLRGRHIRALLCGLGGEEVAMETLDGMRIVGVVEHVGPSRDGLCVLVRGGLEDPEACQQVPVSELCSVRVLERNLSARKQHAPHTPPRSVHRASDTAGKSIERVVADEADEADE